jgi:hypothetical protein
MRYLDDVIVQKLFTFLKYLHTLKLELSLEVTYKYYSLRSV